MLSQICSEFYSKGVTAMDVEDAVHTGRPHGGIAILWKKTLGDAAKPVMYDDGRLLGLELNCLNTKLLIINAYMPYCSPENSDEYEFYLAKLESIISAANTHCSMIMGDLNANLIPDTVTLFIASVRSWFLSVKPRIL